MKKKLLAMTLASAMLASALAGCGGSSASTDNGGSSADSGDAYNISVIVKLTDSHFNKVMAGAKAYADEHDNVNVDIQSPTAATSYDEQVNMIETAVGNPSTNALVVAPLQSDSASTLIANTDKVVIALDTDFASEKKSAFVGTGNESASKEAAVAAVKKAQDSGVDKPTVLIVTGVQGDETHDARMNGYKAGVEEAGGEVVEVQYCDGMAEKAATAMESVMQKFPDGIDIVLSSNDDMAMSVVKIIKDSGNAKYADTIVCGFDGNQSAIQAVKDGSLAMDVAQNGYDMGYKAVEAAVKCLQGETVDAFIDSGVQVVDSSNVDSYIDDQTAKGLWESLAEAVNRRGLPQRRSSLLLTEHSGMTLQRSKKQSAPGWRLHSVSMGEH